MIVLERIEFDDLEVLVQLEYINNELVKGNTVTRACEAVGIGRSTISERFIKEGYKFSKISNRYIYDKNNIKARKKQVPGQMDINDLPKSQSHTGTAVVNKQLDSQDIVKVEIELQEFKSIKTDILELLEKKNELLEMLKNYESKTNIIDIPQLDINTLPQDLQRDIITKSIKLYNPIYESFDKLCKSYSSIKKQDLVSLALLEFTNKYKK